MKLADRYRMDRRVGEGGGGGVFLVRDRLADDALMVLKRLHLHAHAGVAQWLVNEFQVLAQLDLPAVARVFDFGLAEPDADDPGGAFFTREFVDGVPLDEAFRRGPPSAARLVELFATAGETLRAMHRVGVVHGDLKPANLVVPHAGGRAAVVLIDFGLAHGALGAAERVRGGTLAFMPPERCARLLAGESLDPDPSADVFALALSLLFVLGLESPESPTPETLRSNPEWVALAELGRVGASRDANRRFATAEDFVAALYRAVPSAAPIASAMSRVVLRPEGRESELGVLLDQVARKLIQRDGGASVVLLTGEEGSGRSTLLRELTWRAQLRGVQVLHIQGEPGEGPSERLRQGAQILSGINELDLLPDPLVAALRLALRPAPVLLLVDDLDRADAQFISLLRSVAYGFEGTERLLTVASATSRTDAVLLAPQRVVALGELDESAVTALCQQILGAVEPGVVAAVRARTSSLPLAVTEILQALAQVGAVTAADVHRIELPPRAQDLARRHAASLTPEECHAVAAVYALGVPADQAALAAMSVSSRATDLARARGVLVMRANATLVAANPTVAVAAVDRLDEPSRMKLFHDAAAHLDARDAAPTQRAWAHLRAGDLSAALAQARRAAITLRASGVGHVGAALFRAIRQVQEDVVSSEDLLIEAELEAGAGDYQAAIAVARLASRRLDATPSEVLKGLRVECNGLAQIGQLSEARVGCERGLALATETDDHVGFLHEIARIDFAEGQYARARIACETAIARTPSGSMSARLSSLAGLCASYVGDVAGASEHLERALALWADTDSPREEAVTLAYLAIARDRAGDPAAARAMYERALERAREGGDSGQMASARLNLASLLEQQGDLPASLDHLAAAEKLARRAGSVRVLLGAQLNLASHMLRLGSYERALAGLQQVLLDARESGMRMIIAHALQGLGLAHARLRSFDLALKTLGEAIAEFRATGDEDAASDATLDLIETLLDCGDGPHEARAEELLLEQPAPTDATSPQTRARLAFLRARILMNREDFRAASRGFVAALDALGDENLWELRAAILTRRATCHQAAGAELHARKDREQALAILEQIAVTLPPDLRSAFWSVSARAQLRSDQFEASSPQESSTSSLSVMNVGLSSHAATVAAQDHRLILLIELSRRVNEARTLDAVLEQTTRAAAELTNAESALVLLLDDKGALTQRALLGPEVAGEQFSRSIAESALIDGEVLASHNAQKDQRFSDFRSVHEREMGAVAAVPIRARGRTLGVLYIENRHRRARWTSLDVSLLRTFAEQAGTAAERATLIEQLESRTHELEVARREIEHLLAERTAELATTRESLARAEEALRTRFTPQGMVATSESMRRVLSIVERVRDADVPVVIEGESGTGKELIARALHFTGSRSTGPFVVVHCGAIPETLMESELFGHVKGAFTGADRDRKGLLASANKGTVVFDEIADMSAKMQVELLRVIQDRKIRPVGAEAEESIDVRIIAISNQPLLDLVAAGKIREDLFYRLSVVTLRLPPLRERAEEIPALASMILARCAEEHGMARKRLTRDALDRLVHSPWPGNVRQLRHSLESAAVLVDGDVIDAAALALSEPRERTSVSLVPPTALSIRKASERQRILDALEECDWNKVKAAKLLGLPRRTLYRRLSEHNLLDP
ncbi:MAG: sigma 54-interacting transcriptional regulator [Deltaproteobacteria bacterium]|nr:sigma 54-interacting transcriptional regulator [Deltaproteobacteria bacterium]